VQMDGQSQRISLERSHRWLPARELAGPPNAARFGRGSVLALAAALCRFDQLEATRGAIGVVLSACVLLILSSLHCPKA
jgi:hypothetical protein